MGTQLPSPKMGQNPKFSAHVYCHQTAGCIKMPLGMEVGLSPGDFVLDGDPGSPSLKGYSPQFLANVRCGQATGWTKMALGVEIGLGPGGFVFDGDPATPRTEGHPPHPVLGPCLLWPNGWMDEDATWYGSRPRPMPHCIRRGPSSARKGQSSPPSFSAHVYCGSGRPSQLLLSACTNGRPKNHFSYMQQISYSENTYSR